MASSVSWLSIVFAPESLLDMSGKTFEDFDREFCFALDKTGGVGELNLEGALATSVADDSSFLDDFVFCSVTFLTTLSTPTHTSIMLVHYRRMC